MFIGLQNSSRAIVATSCFCVLFPLVLQCYAYAETYKNKNRTKNIHRPAVTTSVRNWPNLHDLIGKKE